jgi:hypothetical protein
MGIAEYNRGSASISNQITMAQRDPIFLKMDLINGLPKKEVTCLKSKMLKRTHKPFSRVAIKSDPVKDNVWWVLDTEKMWDGKGFAYKSLADAVRSWDISLVEYNAMTDTWYADPD